MKNVSRPSNPPDELAQNVSKKSPSDELFLHFFAKVQNLAVFSFIYMIRIRFFLAWWINSELFSGGTVKDISLIHMHMRGSRRCLSCANHVSSPCVFDYSTSLSLLTIFSLIILSFFLPINFIFQDVVDKFPVHSRRWGPWRPCRVRPSHTLQDYVLLPKGFNEYIHQGERERIEFSQKWIHFRRKVSKEDDKLCSSRQWIPWMMDLVWRKLHAIWRHQGSRHTRILGNAFKIQYFGAIWSSLKREACNFTKRGHMQSFSTTHYLQLALRKRQKWKYRMSCTRRFVPKSNS